MKRKTLAHDLPSCTRWMRRISVRPMLRLFGLLVLLTGSALAALTLADASVLGEKFFRFDTAAATTKTEGPSPAKNRAVSARAGMRAPLAALQLPTGCNPRPTGDSGDFEVEGNLAADDSLRSDWLTLPFTRLTDKYNSSTDEIFSGSGDKFNDDPNTWNVSSQSAPDKNDIGNVLYHTSFAVNGDAWLKLAADRLTTNGDNYIDFELFQKPVTLDATGIHSGGTQCGRTVGDILLTVGFNNGGTTPTFIVSRWQAIPGGSGCPETSNNPAYNFVNVTASLPPGSFCIAANPALVNGVPYLPFGNSSYVEDQFVEVALNVSQILAGIGDPCRGFVSMLVKSKASTSDTAQIKDFIAPQPLNLSTGPSVTVDSAEVCAGEAATLTAKVTGGSAPYGYTWTRLSDNTVVGNEATLTVSPTETTSYKVDISDARNCVLPSSTATATVTVNPLTTTSDPSDQTVCQGAKVSFATTAGGTGPFTYAWTLDGAPIGSEASVEVDTSKLAPGSYQVCVTTTGKCGNPQQCATLVVQASTAATELVAQTACQGMTANFTTTASGGDGTFTYQWKLDNVVIPNATNSSVAIDTTALLVGEHTVAVVVTGNCGTVTRSTTLTVQANTTATDLTPATVCQEATANFSTTASGGNGAFSYQWKLDGVNIPDATNSSVAINTTGLSGGEHSVAVVVSGNCGTIIKSTKLTVQAKTAATNLTSQIVCQGANVNFSTTASGGNGTLTYQWKLDDVDIPGAISNSVAINTALLTPGAHTVAVVVSGTCGTVTRSATLTVTDCLPGFCSYTQGGWGATPQGNNPARRLRDNFTAVFPSGIEVGIPGVRSMRFLSARAVDAYLPAGGTPGVLTGLLVNPSTSSAGVFGGQVLALKINVAMSDAGRTAPGYGNLLYLGAGSLQNLTVRQILAVAETALGGGPLPAGYTIASLNDLATKLNEAFDNWQSTAWAIANLKRP